VLVLLGLALAGPAPDISRLEITDCNCHRCHFKQIGYALHGPVIVKQDVQQVMITLFEVDSMFCAVNLSVYHMKLGATYSAK
jgi:hypothetical protein